MSNGFVFAQPGISGPNVIAYVANPGGGPAPSAAQVVFVSKGGSDATGDGSQAKPFLTIEKALQSITDATTAKRYQITVGPGEYADPFQVKPWVSIVGGGSSSGFYGVTEITAPADSLGFDVSFATSGFSVFWLSHLVLGNHQTFDYTTIGNQQIQSTWFDVDVNSGASIIGAGTGGVDNWTLDDCLVYGGLVAQGIQFLFTIGGTQFLGGTVTVQAAPNAGALESTTWLAQNTAIGASFNPTNVHALWAAPTPVGFNTKLDWTNVTVNGVVTLDGANALAVFSGLRPKSVIQVNGAPAPTWQPIQIELIFTASTANALAALQAAGTIPKAGTLRCYVEGYGGGGGSGGGQGGAAGGPGQGGGAGGGAHYCAASIDVNLANGIDVNIGGGGSAGTAGVAGGGAGGNGGDGGSTNVVDHALGNPLAGFIGAQGGNGGGSVLPFTPGGGGINFNGPSPRGVTGAVAAAGLEGCGGQGGAAGVSGFNGNPSFVGLNQPGVLSGGGGGGIAAGGQGGGGGGGGGGPQKNGANGANGTAANGNPGNPGTANGGNGAGGGSGGAGAANTGGAGAAGGSGWLRLTATIQ